MFNQRFLYVRSKTIGMLLTCLICGLTVAGLPVRHAQAQELTTLEFVFWEEMPNDFEAQAAAFMEMRPDINVEIMAIPYADYLAVLTTNLAAGTGPDLMLLSRSMTALLYKENDLRALDELPINFEDYSEDAFESNRFDGTLYAAPVYQNACLPYWYSLGAAASTEKSSAVDDFIAFLLAPQQQAANFELGWYPVYLEYYQEVAAECPPIQPLPFPTADEVVQGMDTVQSLSENLGGRLERHVLDTNETTVVIQISGERTVQAVAAPAMPVPSIDSLQEGVIVGAIRIEEDSAIPPDDYVIKCRSETGSVDDITCTFNEIEVSTKQLIDVGILVVPTPGVAVYDPCLPWIFCFICW